MIYIIVQYITIQYIIMYITSLFICKNLINIVTDLIISLVLFILYMNQNKKNRVFSFQIKNTSGVLSEVFDS